MDSRQFDEWLEGGKGLTQQQRRRTFMVLVLAEAADEQDDGVVASASGSEVATVNAATLSDPEAGRGADQAVMEAVSAVPASPVVAAAQKRVEAQGCPHCGDRRVRRWGRANGLPRHRCSACGRTFNGLTGTPLARLRKKECWQDQAAALIAGESVSKAADRCGVAYTTAFRWRHRFLAAPAIDKPNRLVGIVEADEMFILESFKGKRDGLPRKARKRGGKAIKRGLSAEQIPVLVARDRAGATIDAVLPRLDRASVTAVLDGVITPANQLCCDGGKAIVAFARREKIPYHILPAPGVPKPEAPAFHINNVNGYHGRFKEWARRFHGVATKYLDRYLGWRRTLEAAGPSVQPEHLLSAAVGLGPYQQLTI
jgi:transposase-like protein